ncbi:MAG TPA: M23 family metallopeptidase [Thermodesulfobacteriota bacterium]|nr:M23 family metallopeptidase [Thermodesulfobacteriota bacterium]
MNKDHLTIMLITPGSKGPKALNLKISHLKIAAFSFIFFTVVSLISFGSTYTFYKASESKTRSVRHLANTIDTLSQDLLLNKSTEAGLRNKMMNIENKLLEMQEMLDKKGIKKDLAVGGEFIPADRLSISYVDYMQKDIDDLFDTMKNLPVGSPLDGRINSGFGYRKDPFRSSIGFHSGVDIDAKFGDPVVATADGVVKKTGWQGSYGKTVVLQHEEGFETIYGHLSKISVEEGQKVKVGEVIGKAGNTGRSTGTHLHYEVVKDGKRVNPSNFLSLK